MKPLVAYQSSGDSDSDAEEPECRENLPSKSPGKNDSSQIKGTNTSLPISLPTKTKEAVKITVPSLKEFEDDEKDESRSKKLKKSSGGGLISMLPPPKYSKPAASQKSFVPYVLSKKQAPSNSSSVGAINNPNCKELTMKPMPSSKALVRTVHHFEDDPAVIENDENSPMTDFFSLQEPSSHEPKCEFSVPLNNNLKSIEKSSQMVEGPLQINNQHEASFTLTENQSIPLPDQPENAHTQFSEPTSSVQNYYAGCSSLEGQSSNNSYFGYPEISPGTTEYSTDERFLRLQGKKRKGEEEIKIIDVSVDDQLSDKTEWLTKNITQEQVHRPSRKKGDMPTQLQKRKHQITYLAFQAKERELELKNQWSQNRLTKRETQAKYGF